MRKLTVVLIILVFLAGCASNGLAEPDNPSDSPDDPNTASAPDITGAPSAGDDGTIPFEEIESPLFTLSSLDFLDENNGWIIQNNTILLKTTDGGEHWSEVGGADNRRLDKVRFVSPEEGWAISGKSESTDTQYSRYARYFILHTTDGGASWAVQWQSGEQLSATKLDIWFQDSDSGAIQIGSELCLTRDGGEKWQFVSFGTDDFMLLNMCFTDAETGWAVGIGPGETVVSVLHTADGGENWERQYSTHEMTTDAILSIGITFLNDRTGWFTALDTNKNVGELYRTDDGGVSWELNNDSIGSVRPYPREIDFISNQEGWIPVDCGAGPLDGGLGYTCDGGKSFTYTEASDIDIDGAQKVLGFTEIDFITEQTGWAVARNMGSIGNSLLKTADGGDTWKQVWP